MKTRNGFVSNSSSSSFIVPVQKFGEDFRLQMCLTPLQYKSLRKYGFKLTGASNPYLIEAFEDKLKRKLTLQSFKHSECYASYEVICNQDNVLLFLFENSLPFMALVHYGQTLYSYDGMSDYYYTMANVINDLTDHLGKHKVSIETYQPQRHLVSEYIRKEKQSRI